jgi:hypothetical protein
MDREWEGKRIRGRANFVPPDPERRAVLSVGLGIFPG